MVGLNVRYPVRCRDDEIEDIVAELEEAWAEDRAEEWPVEKAARICPVFRYLTGRAGW